MPTAAWLLIGIGCALVLFTLLVVSAIPSGKRHRRSARSTTRRLAMPSFTIPSGSPVGSLLQGFSYLYAPLSFAQVRHNVSGRLAAAIARIDAIDPLAAPERVGQAVQQLADFVSPEEPPPTVGGEAGITIVDQPRRREQMRPEEQA